MYPLHPLRLLLGMAACVLLLSPAAAFGQASDTFNLELFITDAEGNGQNIPLTMGMDPAASDGFEQGEDQEAPPFPPEVQIYDARIVGGSVQLVTDIRQTADQITYQFIYRGEIVGGSESPVTLSWNDAGLPDGALRLSDQQDGSGSFNVDLDGASSVAAPDTQRDFNGYRQLFLVLDLTAVNATPAVDITVPADGSSFDEGTSIQFEGTATDDEDGDLSSSLSWSSDLDGALGTGASINATLSVGTHIITASVQDTEGAEGSDQITVTVQDSNVPPTADAGPDQTVTDTDGSGSEPVTLDGSASFDNDGTIVSYAWTNELGTQIATGVQPVFSFAQGTTTVTLTVTDDDGATGTDDVLITVNEAPNENPVADAGPDQTVTDTDGSGSEPVTLDGSASFDNDGTIVSYAWTNELGTQIATGVQPVFSFAQGTTTVTLTVTDDDGATGTDDVLITVNAPAADTTPPTITLLGASPLGLIEGETYVEPGATATDDTDGDLSSEIVIDASAVDTSTPGSYTVTYNVTDAAGNAATEVTRTVNVSAASGTIAVKRINAGGAAYTDTEGNAWEANDPSYYTGGTLFAKNSLAIDGTEDDVLYQTEVYGGSGASTLDYAIPLDGATGPFTVYLHFAEIFVGVEGSGSNKGEGDRIFDVSIEGNLVLDDVDLFALVGPATALIEAFNGITDVDGDGFLDMTVDASVDNGKISAIAILGTDTADTTPPVITLLGDNPLELTVGEAYVEPGATATDDTDGDLSSEIVIDASAVDTSTPGSYTVTYNVTDAAGNAATEVTRTVDVSEPAPPSALVEINPGSNLTASTFADNAYQITNTAASGGPTITQVVFDLSTGILPDMVFDPVGSGGDATSQCLTANSGAAATGFVAPADPCVDPYSAPRNGGFDVLTVDFSDFGPGESFFFTTDIDPNSIQGVAGAGDAGAVSGYELVGATVTVTFGDGTTVVSSLYEDGSLGGSQAVIAPGAPATPSINVQGLGSPSTVGDLNQTIEVAGPVGSNVSLLQMDSRLYIASGDPPFDVDPSEEPFYANEAMSGKALFSGVIPEGGVLEVPVTLLVTNSGDTTPDGGLNQFIAVLSDGPYAVDQQASPTSNSLTLKYDPSQADTTPPVITLLGDNPLELTVGEAYVEPGATATDDTDGDLSSEIVIDASGVDTSTPGSYTVTYNVTDAAGNAATEVTRTVNVSEPVVDFDVPLSITPSSGGSSSNVGATLTFGTAPGATDAFDEGLDRFAPPPPPAGAFDVRFRAPGFLDLINDFRASLTPETPAVSWLGIVQADLADYPMTLSWEQEELPAEGRIEIRVDGTVVADMRTTTTYDLPAACDVPGSCTSTFEIAYELVVETTFSLEVGEGWELLGLPNDPDDKSYTSVFANPPLVQAPFTWDGRYVVSETLAFGEGFWALFDEPATYDITGVEEGIVELVLDAPGWYMFSGPSCAFDIANIQDPDGIITPNTIFVFNEVYEPATTIEQGAGAWLNVSEAGTLTLDCAASGPAAAEAPVAAAKQGATSDTDAPTTADAGAKAEANGDGTPALAATFTVSDGLYSVELVVGMDPKATDGFDPAYDLLAPPPPPSGAMDARLRGEDDGTPTDYYADVRAYALEEAQVFAVAYSGTSGTEELVLTWDPVALAGLGQFTLVSDLGATPGFALDMSSANQVDATQYPAIADGAFIVWAEASSVGVGDGPELPGAFALQGNYPNPAAGRTQLVVDLPEAAEVDVQVFDVLGRTVLNVQPQQVAAGAAQTIPLDTSALPAGAYFYRVRAQMPSGLELASGRLTLID